MTDRPKRAALQAALDMRFDSDAGKDLSMREYLHALLQKLWREEEDFSGKRPFGNSAWQWDVYAALVRGGHVPRTVTEFGDVEPASEMAAHAFVSALIDEALLPKTAS